MEMPVARITFQKRQKEMKRKEKQLIKAEKRAQRKVEKDARATSSSEMPEETLGVSEETV